MLCRLSQKTESLIINDGLGPTIFLTRSSDPIDIPIARISRYLESGHVEKAQYAGIENDMTVAVDFNGTDYKVRPVGPAVKR